MKGWLLGLYPAAWRRRYGDELAALLEDEGLSPRVIADTVLGAARAHFQPAPKPTPRPAATVAPIDLTPASLPEEPPPPPARPRWGTALAEGTFERAIDQVIRQAMERGEFDNLPGTGKPIDLRENPFAGPDAFAFHVVAQAGEAPPWIGMAKDLDADEARLRLILSNTVARLRHLRVTAPPSRYEVERARARDYFLSEAARVDRKLERFNLHVPSFMLDRGRLTPPAAQRRFDEAIPA